MSAANLVTLGGFECPVCGDQTRLAIDVGDFQLYECSRCDSLSSNAMARGATLRFEPKNYFENAYADKPRWDKLIAKVSAAGLTVRSVLDVGCGTGAFLHYFCSRARPAHAVGIELCEERAMRARQLHDQLTVHTGDATEVVEGMDEKFDLITLWDVFEHVASPADLLKALSAKLSERGWIVIQTINEHSLLPWLGRVSYRLTGGRLRSVARRTHEAHHLVFFSPGAISLLAESNNLRVRQRWFDRLDAARMDAGAATVALASWLLRIENGLGNGLFVNVIMDRPAGRSAT